MHPSVYEPPHQHPAPGASRREWGSTRAIAALGLGFRVPQDATDCWTRCDLARLEPSRTELNLPKPWCWTSESQKEKRRWGEPRWKAAAVAGNCLDATRKPLHPGRAQRWPVSGFDPLWTCREAQGVGRAEGSAACPQLRALACCGCSNGAAQQQSEFRSTAPRPSIAGCPQRSGGTRQAGSPFLCLLSFGEAKESRSAAGPRPGLRPQPNPHDNFISKIPFQRPPHLRHQL